MYIPLGKLLHSVVSSRNNRLLKRQIVNHGLSLVYYTADKSHLATITTDGKKWKKKGELVQENGRIIKGGVD
jgi:hypothetical protein